ncbi:MAG: Asp-tRNA(Asn)/Glu-tRNA(Gln) amidotransferase subunit GatA [Pirellulales bacterium]|nr:Asp-tRNA(Asn)/Glu-tRNA(Gln) amidotransferase subunit GatA [Pirellulales bacterium]
MAIVDYTATELLERMDSRDLTSRDITAAYLAQIETHHGEVNALVRWDAEGAMRTAEAIDSRRELGEPVGLLAGVPVVVKDNLCTSRHVTSCASRMLANYCSPYDATVIERLKAADAVILGKGNMDEFAMGASTETSAFGPTHNPWKLGHIPGGSSGGSAAAVAASMAPVSLGSDTGGSIRQPSAHCGVVGLKPTYGRVSRYGLIAFGSSLDCIGPMGRTAEDVARVMSVLAGNDPKDATSIAGPVPRYEMSCREPLDGVRLGVIDEQFGEGLDDEVASKVEMAIREFEGLGATVTNISLPHIRYAIAAYYIIAPSEASSNLARFDGAHYGYRAEDIPLDEQDGPLVAMYRKTRREGFGEEVKRRIMLGTYSLSAGYYDAYYLRALKIRRLIAQDFADAYKNVDFLIGPVTPTPAFEIGEKMEDPLAMYLGDSYTVGANLAGLPALSLPCGHTAEGLPVAVQLQGPALSEEGLLQLACAFQQESDWHLMRPELTKAE